MTIQEAAEAVIQDTIQDIAITVTEVVQMLMNTQKVVMVTAEEDMTMIMIIIIHLEIIMGILQEDVITVVAIPVEGIMTENIDLIGDCAHLQEIIKLNHSMMVSIKEKGSSMKVIRA
ncbi:uncharacterized protein PRCAT00002320001 [Priceomyces carsonii]|uniref:uncharacterized protein n=1 Tax=Priceomyces carsonii TaxID=28549 RepID=UPI002EDA938C|nr:unnamed protein product [Priceomyces carsonii]